MVILLLFNLAIHTLYAMLLFRSSPAKLLLLSRSGTGYCLRFGQMRNLRFSLFSDQPLVGTAVTSLSSKVARRTLGSCDFAAITIDREVCNFPLLKN